MPKVKNEVIYCGGIFLSKIFLSFDIVASIKTTIPMINTKGINLEGCFFKFFMKFIILLLIR
ncbi:hypothetical protein D3C81_2106680 [compost metagenome]